MANRRKLDSSFIFLVEWGKPGETDTVRCGFNEVSGLGGNIHVNVYQEGGRNHGYVQQVPGLHKVTNITLKRGIMAANHLHDWMEDLRLRPEKAFKNVTVKMRDEAGQTRMKWTLVGARPVKYTGPSLSTKDSETAVEELVLSVEGVNVEPIGVG